MAFVEIVNSSNNYTNNNGVPFEPSDDIRDITDISVI